MKPKILFLDIETSPIISYTWGINDQNIGLNQMHTDWNILSFAAKWKDSKEIIYMDLRCQKDITDDKRLLDKLWKLLDESDIVVSQNGVKFDIKKINARLIQNGFSPPSSFKNIDTLKIAKKYFGFTSNKLEYMSKKLNVKHKKKDHKKFPGMELWKECLKGNKEAWQEMELYNKEDILSLEELYNKLYPWDNSINFNLYHDEKINICHCGYTKFQKNGFKFTAKGKFQRYKCKKCGSESRSTINLFSKAKKKSLRVK